MSREDTFHRVKEVIYLDKNGIVLKKKDKNFQKRYFVTILVSYCGLESVDSVNGQPRIANEYSHGITCFECYRTLLDPSELDLAKLAAYESYKMNKVKREPDWRGG